jgi:hypothetical protein
MFAIIFFNYFFNRRLMQVLDKREVENLSSSVLRKAYCNTNDSLIQHADI